VEQSIEGQTEAEAIYQLESAVCCPHCSTQLETVHVVRLLRTRVNFTSSLPRRGYVCTCPDCHKVIPGVVG
jgi:hypothetical protein